MTDAVHPHGHDFTGFVHEMNTLGGRPEGEPKGYTLKCSCNDGLYVTLTNGTPTVSYCQSEGGTLTPGHPVTRTHADSMQAKQRSDNQRTLRLAS